MWRWVIIFCSHDSYSHLLIRYVLILVGEPGTGKTALAEGLALRIFNRDVPTNLLNNRIFALDVAALHAGASYKVMHSLFSVRWIDR